MNVGREYKQGIYHLKNPEKYCGKKNPRYLSSYELKTFKFLDNHSSVIKWGAETIVVPYYNPVKKRKARYMVDIYVKYQDKDGNIIEELLEIKPKAQAKRPVKRGRKKISTFQQEELTYATNIAKWQAAEKFANERGWNFRVITEDDIYKYN